MYISKDFRIINGKRPNMIIGIGPRRGVTREEVSAAIESALHDAEIGMVEKRGCDSIEVTTRETRVDTQRFCEHRGSLATQVSFTKI